MTAHQHKQPIGTILKKIEEHLRQQGGRMTGVRKEVVTKMGELGKPKTAYQIVDAINKKRKIKLSAMSVYRTLEFLIEAGVVLKIESTNTFTLCLNGSSGHSHLMMVCDKCGNILEIDDRAVSKTLEKTAHKHGHTIKHHVIELHGLCSDC